MPDAAEVPRSRGPFAPFVHPVFRALWLAGLVSNLGTWMHEVGEAWLMTSLSPSPLKIALLQSADSLAIFLLALPAGALADLLDRRRVAIFTQLWMFCTAGLLALLTWLGAMTPSLLIGLTFVMGVGAAMNGPVWQALVPETVPRSDLAAAVTLGGISMNIARSIGPAIGGLIVAAAGPFAVFALNGLSFVLVAVILLGWKRPPPEKSAMPPERWAGAVVSGLRYVRYSRGLLGMLVRSGVTLFFASCLLGLLPLYARHDLDVGSAGYGALIGCMGVGAVAAAFALEKLRARLAPDALLTGATVLFAGGMAGLAATRIVPVAGLAIGVAGLGWMAMVSTFNIAVQQASPSWVRARVLAVYLLVFQGAVAVGSITWGALAVRTGMPAAIFIAAAGVGAAQLLALVFPMATSAPDPTPAAWPEPDAVIDIEPDDGPVLVAIEYQVAAARVTEFVVAMRERSHQRRRDGAFEWELFRDPAVAERFLETFLVASWAEHMRQHGRALVADQELARQIHALVVPGTKPRSRHLIAANVRATPPPEPDES